MIEKKTNRVVSDYKAETTYLVNGELTIQVSSIFPHDPPGLEFCELALPAILEDVKRKIQAQ